MAQIHRKMNLHLLQALVLAVVCMAVLCGAHASEAPSELGWNKRALLTGSPVSARQLPARQGTPGQIVLAEQYRVRLENVDVVYGEIDVKRLTIDLQASQPTAITGNRRIFVLVEIRENGQYNALTWGVPLSVICVDSAIVESSGIGGDFYEFEMAKGAKCTNAEWFQ
ncbi:hypothetical protein [Aquimonas voraii]|uniref:hypothetical protein n=1 Tax=Aquimonas voraii TaxID=265719 RepID=UPI00116008D1|nr:hypothetical protein [Aquimonas voraii]